MSECNFIKILNRLKKSSSDSIDNTESFDDYKKYIHVVRDVEIDLKSILQNINESNKKTLVLLCGSAGDGKSHLLSYLKNSDEQHLLDDYLVYNDATESNAPNKTAIETLSEILAPFNDNNINDEGKNIILAINLGVLSNFIESDFGKDFSLLREYVYASSIFSSKIDDDLSNECGHFRHISFSDYHMFLLEKDGINPEYIEDLFEKIILKSEDNPFFVSYKNDCKSCPLFERCPVRVNYEYFSQVEVRHYISSLLTNVIVRDKEILTTRELLNYIFDIMVPNDFDFSQMPNSILDESSFLKKFFDGLMPSLLFDCDDVTVLMNKTHKYNPLLVRDEDADNIAIEYYVADDARRIVEKLLKESPFSETIVNEKTIDYINRDRSLKQKVFNVLWRANEISTGSVGDVTFCNYVKDLYSYNAGCVSKLANLYSDVETAVIKWCGNETEGNICIDDLHKGFALFENIKFDAYLDNIPSESNEKSIKRFLSYVVVEFQDSNNNPISLDVDYSLYELIEKLKNGYTQTAEDRNNHADFISFIEKILKTGSADSYMVALSDSGKKAILEKTKFGVYRFKVVK